jgi:hypothetical protein
MTLEEIMDSVDKQLEIDAGNLGNESLRQVKIFSAIQRMYVTETRKLETTITNFEKVKAKRTQYYSGKATAEEYKAEPLRVSVLKGDIPDLLKVDPKMIETKGILNEQERIVKYLEDSKKQLAERNFNLRLAIDFQKTQLGI